MKNKIDWSRYKFRASQIHKILVGTLPDKKQYDKRIYELESERDNLVNLKGNKIRWTDSKKNELEKLIEKKNTPYFQLLPKTMISELRKIHRAETFNRNFNFTNKFVQKGLAVEENAISTYQNYRKKVLGISGFFRNNKERLENDYVTGECDLTDTNDFANCNEGFDIKSSWELETFPFKEDKLDLQYEYQNQCYMWLSGAEKWTTASVLENVTEDLLHKEKMKWFYALGSPMSEEDANYEEYVKEAKSLEIRLIFDYDKFVKDNPSHLMEISKQEWEENYYDIPLEDRVVEKVSIYNEQVIEEFKERIEVAREYLCYLDKN